MEVSLRYPPVQGRLHTRYAPVRRSSAMYCYILLPLDLHVLSLPLAFILSQDQTLHCKNCSFTSLTRLRVSYIPYICKPTHAISNLSSVSMFSCFQLPFSGRKRLQKYNHFPNPPNFFSKKSQKNKNNIVYQLFTERKIFIGRVLNPRKVRHQMPPIGPKSVPLSTENAKTGG